MNSRKLKIRSLCGLMIVTGSVLASVNSYAAKTAGPPPPGHSTERRVDQDASIITEFNILNDAIEAGVQRGLDVNSKFLLIDLMKQANALLASTGMPIPQPQPYPQPMPQPQPYPQPMPQDRLMVGDHVVINPNQIRNHWWGADEGIVQVILSGSRVRVLNLTKNTFGDFNIVDLMKSVSYANGLSIGQRVFVTLPAHWWNRNNCAAYIDMLFSNGMAKLRCPQLNAEGLFNAGEFVRY